MTRLNFEWIPYITFPTLANFAEIEMQYCEKKIWEKFLSYGFDIWNIV